MKKNKRTRSIEVALLEREYRRLQEISFRARRAGGAKLPAALVLRALIRLLRRLEVDLRGVKTGAELSRRLRRAKLRKK